MKKDNRRIIPVHQPNAAAQPVTQRPQIAGRQRWLPSAVGIALLLIGGVVYGLQTNRWNVNDSIQEAIARLDKVPKTIGDWDSRDLTLPEAQRKLAGADGYVYRIYHNRETDEEVYVMLLCGSHGPISLHSPTVCFTGAGWQLEKSPARVSADDDADKRRGDFWVARFRKKNSAGTGRMLAFWSWNMSGRWDASDSPRMQFAGSGHLYKLYVTESLPSKPESQSTETSEPDSCKKFMRLFLPALKQAGI